MKKGILVAFLLFLAASVQAQQCTQLTYVGAPFVSVTATASNGAANNGQPVYSPLTGVITLSAALPANAKDLAVTPASWSFTEGSALYGFFGVWSQ